MPCMVGSHIVDATVLIGIIYALSDYVVLMGSPSGGRVRGKRPRARVLVTLSYTSSEL